MLGILRYLCAILNYLMHGECDDSTITIILISCNVSHGEKSIF